MGESWDDNWRKQTGGIILFADITKERFFCGSTSQTIEYLLRFFYFFNLLQQPVLTVISGEKVGFFCLPSQALQVV